LLMGIDRGVARHIRDWATRLSKGPEDPEVVRRALESYIAEITEGRLDKIAEDLRKKAGSAIARVRRKEAENRLEELKKVVASLSLQYRSTLREIEDLQKEREKVKADFYKLVEDGKKAGLPERAGLTPEQREAANNIQVMVGGMEIFPGREVYRALDQYNDRAAAIDNLIELAKEQRDTLEAREKQYRSQIDVDEKKIAEMNYDIAALERYETLAAANVTIGSGGRTSADQKWIREILEERVAVVNTRNPTGERTPQDAINASNRVFADGL